MAATHHRSTMVMVAFTATLALVLVGVVTIFRTDSTFPVARKLTPQRTRPAPTTPVSIPTRQQAKPSLADPDSRFTTLISEWSKERHYLLRDRQLMITAAGQVCAMVSAGQSLSHASAALKAGYDLTGEQAAAVGAAALEVYCPNNKV